MLIKLEMSPTITLQPGDIPSSQSWLPTLKMRARGREGERMVVGLGLLISSQMSLLYLEG